MIVLDYDEGPWVSIARTSEGSATGMIAPYVIPREVSLNLMGEGSFGVIIIPFSEGDP